MVPYLLHDTFVTAAACAAGCLGEFWVRTQAARNYAPEMLFWAEIFDSLSLPCLRPQWSAPFGLLVYFVLSCLGWVLGRKHFDGIYYTWPFLLSVYMAINGMCRFWMSCCLHTCSWGNGLNKLPTFYLLVHTITLMLPCGFVNESGVKSILGMPLILLVHLHLHLFFAPAGYFHWPFFLQQNIVHRVSKW